MQVDRNAILGAHSDQEDRRLLIGLHGEKRPADTMANALYPALLVHVLGVVNHRSGCLSAADRPRSPAGGARRAYPVDGVPPCPATWNLSNAIFSGASAAYGVFTLM